MMKTKTKLKRKNNWKTKTKIKTKNKSKRKSHCFRLGAGPAQIMGRSTCCPGCTAVATTVSN